MGNPQRNSRKEINLAWLSGFIDGEGSFCTIYKTKPYVKLDGTKHNYYDPSIKVAGTDVPGLEKVTKVLDSLELPYHVSWRIPRKAVYKKSWMVEVKGWKRCNRWCQTLLEYLVVKKADCENMLELCLSRLAKQTKGCNGSPTYTDREYELIQSLRGRNSGYNRLF